MAKEKLADVISLDAYRFAKKIVKLDGTECVRPFHRKKYVVKDPEDNQPVCVACGVVVSLSQHPSMKTPQWYG